MHTPLLENEVKNIPDGESKRAANETIGAIKENVSYINKIVADLQDYAKKTDPIIEEVELEEVIEKTFSNIDMPGNIQAQCTIEPNIKLKTDVSYIRRIVTNLTINAIQAMPNGGKLILDVKCNDEKKGKTVQIRVTDTGVGMSKEVQAKLFTPLFTTKAKGQGFGLVVIKKFVEELGGTISLESEVGKGTTFTIQLPQQDPLS